MLQEPGILLVVLKTCRQLPTWKWYPFLKRTVLFAIAMRRKETAQVRKNNSPEGKDKKGRSCQSTFISKFSHDGGIQFIARLPPPSQQAEIQPAKLFGGLELCWKGKRPSSLARKRVKTAAVVADVRCLSQARVGSWSFCSVGRTLSCQHFWKRTVAHTRRGVFRPFSARAVPAILAAARPTSGEKA